MKRDICVVGILVDERANNAPEVQQVLTRHGSQILSRSGIPGPGRQRGIITLTMQANDNERQKLEDDLKRIGGISVKSFCLADAVE
ncbi:MAG: hypothetical protein A4E52_01075 [Pelotomaculum sp. PtaB.Bin013]|uniref:Iron-only hydrogenase system regulator n=1 Tax=Pelotomaculum isophthalicicum JI TaxID=947010 RepID=A0A9X4H5L6_9FIRM|nr:TM1266 family iron-only hydrogenase system putative regulator [Pelotomaculum isophthalicicum]MDF9407724.1 hypothetical protein [Pelotomaculum isophthalicicum JI]OPX89221.1 MAG: hypothetical protein A4E52_01075 [Pelotomaculum sp. PtaB.Bin013]